MPIRGSLMQIFILFFRHTLFSLFLDFLCFLFILLAFLKRQIAPKISYKVILMTTILKLNAWNLLAFLLKKHTIAWNLIFLILFVFLLLNQFNFPDDFFHHFHCL